MNEEEKDYLKRFSVQFRMIKTGENNFNSDFIPEAD